MSLDDYDWQYRETDRLNELVRSLQSQLDAEREAHAHTKTMLQGEHDTHMEDHAALEQEREAHKRTSRQANEAIETANASANKWYTQAMTQSSAAEAELARINPLYTAACIRVRDAEQRLAEEKAMRAKNIWCCGQAEKRCKELEHRLAQIEGEKARDRVAQEREGAISASQEQSPVPAPAATTTICGFISPGGLLCKFVPHHLHAHSWEPTAPCPLGDACPDAHKYGDVHPAPSEYAAGLAQWAELHQGEKK